MKSKKILLFSSVLLLGFSFYSCQKESKTSNEFAIFFTSDSHTAIEEKLYEDGSIKKFGLFDVAGIKESAKKTYGNNDVLLVDAGDFTSGDVFGTMTNGFGPTNAFKKAGYDVVTLGNHEFDYSVNTLLNNIGNDLDVVCANFIRLSDNKTVFKPYSIKDVNGYKVAFVGVTTPSTLTKSSPKTFKDEKGEYIYTFLGEKEQEQEKLYSNFQSNIDLAKKDGANFVVGLGHLGKGDTPYRWSSDELINNVSGLDLFLDGHSHKVIPSDIVKDKDNKEVTLVTPGCKLSHIAKIVVDKSNRKVTSKLITPSNYKEEGINIDTTASTYTECKKYIDALTKDKEEKFSKKIGSTTFALTGGNNSLMRKQETNLANFCADSIMWNLKDAEPDCGFFNSGTAKDDFNVGDITLQNVYQVHPYSNIIGCINAKGQKILDALEFSANLWGEGGFLQPSLLKYDIDISGIVKRDDKGKATSIDPSKMTVEVDQYKNFVKVKDGVNRVVQNVKIYDKETKQYTDLNPDKTYKVCSSVYLFSEGGDGYTMFKDCDTVLESLTLNEGLAKYISSFNDGVISNDYELSQGRFTIKLEQQYT